MELTEKHYTFHLYRDVSGRLDYRRGPSNARVRSPRTLSGLSMHKLVCNIRVLKDIIPQLLPSNFHPRMISEAIFQREAQAIEWAVSTWPMKILRVYDLLPLEDYLEDKYLTLPLEEGGHGCIADCFITGLLKLKPNAGLRFVDFRKFDKDRTLCKELSRLPILWMKPENRTVERIHELMSDTLVVEKDKVERYLNRIDVVYQNLDAEFKHESNRGPVTIMLDLKIDIDDVPLGLSLQKNTPFKFSSDRLWMKPINDVELALCNISKVIDSTRITHFEYDEPILPRDEARFMSTLDALKGLTNLQALSIPNSLDVACNSRMPAALGDVLKDLRSLNRLSIAHCNLQGLLDTLLGKLTQRFAFLNLRDCRLTEDDLFFLVQWWPLMGLRELNLSCNNLGLMEQVVVALLERMPLLTCFSVSNCMLSLNSQLLLARVFLECSRLKVICMQSYVPLPLDDILELLSVLMQVSQLQRLLLLPGAYAFPGNTQRDREENKIHMLLANYRYLELRGRGDIELE